MSLMDTTVPIMAPIKNQIRVLSRKPNYFTQGVEAEQ